MFMADVALLSFRDQFIVRFPLFDRLDELGRRQGDCQLTAFRGEFLAIVRKLLLPVAELILLVLKQAEFELFLIGGSAFHVRCGSFYLQVPSDEPMEFN